MILGWYENSTSDEIPPEHIWEDGEALERWWELVKERREYRVSGGRPRQSEDAEPADEDLTQNELARAFKE